MTNERFGERRDDLSIHDQVVLGATDQPVIERLARDDGASRAIEFGIVTDPGWCVAWPDANGRCAGAVRGFHESRASRGEHQGYAGVTHKPGGCPSAPER